MQDFGRQKDPAKALTDRIESALYETHTALPGRVKSYSATKQRATVQVQIKRRFTPPGQPEQEILIAPLLEVPVLFPRAGGYSITFPVAVNDPCLVIFSERDIRGWIENGAVAVPPTARKHDYSDAVALLGLYPTPNALSPGSFASGLQLRSDDGTKTFTILSTGVEINSGGVINFVATGNALIEAGGSFTIDGGTAGNITAGTNLAMIAGAILSLVATGAITITPVGAFTVAATGPITITRGANELLTLLSEALDEIGTSTVSGSPLSNASNIAAIKALVDAMRA